MLLVDPAGSVIVRCWSTADAVFRVFGAGVLEKEPNRLGELQMGQDNKRVSGHPNAKAFSVKVARN